MTCIVTFNFPEKGTWLIWQCKTVFVNCWTYSTHEGFKWPQDLLKPFKSILQRWIGVWDSSKKWKKTDKVTMSHLDHRIAIRNNTWPWKKKLWTEQNSIQVPLILPEFTKVSLRLPVYVLRLSYGNFSLQSIPFPLNTFHPLVFFMIMYSPIIFCIPLYFLLFPVNIYIPLHSPECPRVSLYVFVCLYMTLQFCMSLYSWEFQTLFESVSESVSEVTISKACFIAKHLTKWSFVFTISHLHSIN
jgi:hypothetical protein